LTSKGQTIARAAYPSTKAQRSRQRLCRGGEMRRVDVLAVSLLTLMGVVGPFGSTAAAAADAVGVVFEFTQTTLVAHEQALVAYEVVLRNEGTEPAGFGELFIDVPDGFGEAFQYDPMLCLRHPSQDLECDTFALAPGEEFTFAFEYLVRATPGTYVVSATFNPLFDPGPPPPQTLSVSTVVEPSAELQVAWSQFRAGRDVVRRATVRSFGPSIAEDVTLDLSWLGNRGMVAPVSITPSLGTCAPPTASSTQCDLASLAPFDTVTVDVAFRTRDARGLTTTAVVTSATFDIDPSTNTATLQT
jgi:Domain of unknown function DUF11